MTLELPEQPKSNGRRRALGILATVVITALILVGARWFLHGRYHVTTDDATVDGDIVLVTPQVSGTVAKISVEDTMTVKAGDVLVELDATDLKMMRERSEAELLRTVRDVRSLYAQTQSASADAASAQAELSLAQIERDHATSDLTRRQREPVADSCADRRPGSTSCGHDWLNGGDGNADLVNRPAAVSVGQR